MGSRGVVVRVCRCVTQIKQVVGRLASCALAGRTAAGSGRLGFGVGLCLKVAVSVCLWRLRAHLVQCVVGQSSTPGFLDVVPVALALYVVIAEALRVFKSLRQTRHPWVSTSRLLGKLEVGSQQRCHPPCHEERERQQLIRAA